MDFATQSAPWAIVFVVHCRLFLAFSLPFTYSTLHNRCSILSSQPTVNYKEHLWTLISDRTPQPGNPIAHNQAPSSVTPAENWIKKFARASKKIKIYETFLSLEKKGIVLHISPMSLSILLFPPKIEFPPTAVANAHANNKYAHPRADLTLIHACCASSAAVVMWFNYSLSKLVCTTWINKVTTTAWWWCAKK